MPRPLDLAESLFWSVCVVAVAVVFIVTILAAEHAWVVSLDCTTTSTQTFTVVPGADAAQHQESHQLETRVCH